MKSYFSMFEIKKLNLNNRGFQEAKQTLEKSILLFLFVKYNN